MGAQTLIEDLGRLIRAGQLIPDPVNKIPKRNRAEQQRPVPVEDLCTENEQENKSAGTDRQGDQGL